MAIGVGKSEGSEASTVCNALTPPADAAITTKSNGDSGNSGRLVRNALSSTSDISSTASEQEPRAAVD